MASGSAPLIVLHGVTMKRRFPFLQFHRCPPVYSLRVHWVPLFPSSQRRGAFAIRPHPGVPSFPGLRREVGGQASGMPTTPTPPSRTGQDPFSVIRLSRSPCRHASVRIVVRSDDFSKSTHADVGQTPCGPSPCPPHYRKAVRVLCPLRHPIPHGT